MNQVDRSPNFNNLIEQSNADSNLRSSKNTWLNFQVEGPSHQSKSPSRILLEKSRILITEKTNLEVNSAQEAALTQKEFKANSMPHPHFQILT